MKLKTLKHAIKLSSSVKIYIPSTQNVSESVDSQERVREALSFLSSLYGGATSYSAFGAWISPTSGLVTEKITIVESHTTTENLEATIERVYNYALRIKTAYSQESIALEVNGELYLV